MLEWLAGWPGAVWLQDSGTAYLFVNAAHILGIALLLGSILPLDLRLVGGGSGTPLAVLGPFLTRVAKVGLILAVLTGAWLFTVQPATYLGNTAFLYKLGLLGLALANIAWQHRAPGLRQAWRGEPVPIGVRVRAALSFSLWIAALVAGRWIGFI